jgi:hypothetical protein
MVADGGIVDCPHCGLRVVLKGGICPACRRDARDLRDAEANLRRERLHRSVQRLIARGKTRAVIRATLVNLGEDEQLVDEQLAASSVYYRSGAFARGGALIVVAAGALLLCCAWIGILFCAGRLPGSRMLVAVFAVVMALGEGIRRWWRSRRLYPSDLMAEER